MQRQMQEQQEQLEQSEFTASSGGGAVEVVMSGKRELRSVTIQPEVVDPEDVEMLQDLIVAAVNEAMKQVEAASNENLSKLTGGMGGLGGLF